MKNCDHFTFNILNYFFYIEDDNGNVCTIVLYV